MKLLISPAKKMRVERDFLPPETCPALLDRSALLLEHLRSLPLPELKRLLACNDALAQEAYRNFQVMELDRGETPALFAYDGIQYKYMTPGLFTQEQLDYVKEHLRILSGFYGVLRPFDGVKPYRLEMQARFRGPELDSLYDFWGVRLAAQIFSETDCVLNLASKEYSKCVEPYTPAGKHFVTCVFGEMSEDGRIKEKGTLCKMARGEMVRYMAESGGETLEDVKAFRGLGYCFRQDLSSDRRLVFVKEDA